MLGTRKGCGSCFKLCGLDMQCLHVTPIKAQSWCVCVDSAFFFQNNAIGQAGLGTMFLYAQGVEKVTLPLYAYRQRRDVFLFILRILFCF